MPNPITSAPVPAVLAGGVVLWPLVALVLAPVLLVAAEALCLASCVAVPAATAFLFIRHHRKR